MEIGVFLQALWLGNNYLFSLTISVLYCFELWPTTICKPNICILQQERV